MLISEKKGEATATFSINFHKQKTGLVSVNLTPKGVLAIQNIQDGDNSLAQLWQQDITRLLLFFCTSEELETEIRDLGINSLGYLVNFFEEIKTPVSNH